MVDEVAEWLNCVVVDRYAKFIKLLMHLYNCYLDARIKMFTQGSPSILN
jgi:hypothetical protein